MHGIESETGMGSILSRAMKNVKIWHFELRDFTPCIVRLYLIFLIASFPRSFLIPTLVSHLHFLCVLRISPSFSQQCKTQIRWKPEPFCYIFNMDQIWMTKMHALTHARTHARNVFLNLVGYWLSINYLQNICLWNLCVVMYTQRSSQASGLMQENGMGSILSRAMKNFHRWSLTAKTSQHQVAQA